MVLSGFKTGDRDWIQCVHLKPEFGQHILNSNWPSEGLRKDSSSSRMLYMSDLVSSELFRQVPLGHAPPVSVFWRNKRVQPWPFEPVVSHTGAQPLCSALMQQKALEPHCLCWSHWSCRHSDTFQALAEAEGTVQNSPVLQVSDSATGYQSSKAKLSCMKVQLRDSMPRAPR